ncbi:MAG: DUF2516 family protein [Pseudonocardiaceae bacterium]
MENLDYLVYLILFWAAVPVGLYAFAHAALQRTDAYTAADKLTKPAWMGITGGAAALLLFNVFVGNLLLFYLIALVAVLVYLVDVKPAVTEVQRGPRW